MSQYGNYQNPYRPGTQSGIPNRPPPRKIPARKPWNPLWIVFIILGSIGVCVLCCCGSGIAFWQYDQVQTTKEIADLLRDNAVLNEEIGELEKFTFNWSRSMDHDDIDTCVYDAKGSKRNAEVTVNWVVDDDMNVVLVWATVETVNGVERQMLIQERQGMPFGFGDRPFR